MPWSAHAQTVPTLEIADVSASEGEGALEFTVGLAGGATSAQAVTVHYATADGDALAGNDYIGTTGTLTIPSGDSSGVVSVTVNNDLVREIDETFTLTLSNPSNAALPTGAGTVTVTGTILDDERPYISVKALQSDIFTTEPVVVEFTRLGSAEKELSFSYRYDHLAADGSDTLSVMGILLNDIISFLSFAPGERKVEWRLDPVIRPEEQFTFQVRLQRPSGNDDFAFDRTPARVLVHRRPVHRSLDVPDPDGTLPAVSITANSGGEIGVPSLSEDQDATFTLTRTGDISSPLAVRVYTEEPFHSEWAPGTSNPIAAFHNVTFSAGADTATLSVDLDDDGVTEHADWLEAHISPPAGGNYRKGTPNRAYVNIIDDDVDYRETVGLRDLDNKLLFEEGDPINIWSQRDTLSERGTFKPLTYRMLVTQDGSGVPEDLLGIITPVHLRYVESADQNTPLPTLANDGDEPDTRVTFTLLESPYYRIDPNYASITVTVRDLDPEPVLEITDVDAPKGADTIDFRVSFADDVPSLRTVTVDYRTEDGTATAGQDYTETSGTLIIPAGETGGGVTMPLLPESAEGWDQTFTLVLGDPVNATLSGGATTVSATATASYRPEITMTALDAEVLEGEDARFELTRTGAVSEDLTVHVNTQEPDCPCATSVSNPTDIDHDVTFLAGSDTAILAVGTHEDEKEEEHSNFIQAELLSGSNYKRKTTTLVRVNIFDSIPDVTVAVDQETIVEGEIGDGGGKDAIFTLTRTGDASEELTVKVRVDDPERIRCWDHVFWKGNCRAGLPFEQEVRFAGDSATATLAVRIFNDWRDVPDDSAVTVTLIDEESYRPGDPDSASVTLVDDDFASHLTLGTDNEREVTEGEKVRLTVWRADLENNIDAYQEHVPWVLADSRPKRLRETGTTVMAPGRNSFTKAITVPDDDRASSGWTYTFTIDRIEKNTLGDLLELEVEREQYYTVVGSRSVTVRVRDAGGPRVSIAAAADGADITEGEAATFTLTRRGDTSEALTVGISVEDPGKFMRGNHFWADPQPPATVEFAAGSDTATLTLLTMDDWRDIPDGVLKVTIEPGNIRVYRPGNPASASVTVLDNDTRPVFELSADEETLTEGETVVFTVTRTVDFTHDLRVLVYVGIQGQPPRSRTLWLTSDEPEATIEFATEDDDLDEADVVYEMVATVPYTDYTTVAEPHTITVTVLDDDLPRVGIEALSDSYNEGDYASFRLTREGQANSALPIRVRLTQTGRVIRYFPEYTFGDRTIHIWETTRSQDIGFRISSNDGDEEDGAVDLELLPSDDYDIDPDKATDRFTVIDTDSAATLEAFAPAVDEGDGEITLVVSFEGAPPWREEKVTVDYSILSGSATEGEDYTPVSGTLTFEPGEEPLYILVPVVQDSLAEPDETFFLRLSNARNARLPSSARTTTVTIRDDEPRIIVSARTNEEITEGETASFAVIRTGDTTEELLVRLSLLVGSPGSDLSDLLDRSVTIPAGSDSVRLTHDTEDDDIDAAPFTIVAIVRDLADFNLASTYRAYIDNASITVLDNDLPTVTIEADLATIIFGVDDAAFTLTREGDLSIPLTVSLDITQEGKVHGGGSLPDWASFATGPSTATFEAGSSTTNLSLATERQFSQGGQNFTMSRGLVNVALPDSNAYITGDPASAALLLFANTDGFPVVYVEGPSPVTEGDDLVFTLHRTKGVGTSLTVPAILQERNFNSRTLAETYSLHETTFAADSLTATVTVPTEANEINDGNREYRLNVKLGGSGYVGIGATVFGDLGYIWDNQSELYPSFGSGWVRDDDIPTVWVTPETGEHFEDPEHTHPPFTFHRDSYESSLIYVFFAYRQLYRWPPPIPDSVYTSSATKRAAENAWLNPGVLSHTDRFSPGHVGPLGGESAIFLVPNYCGEDVLADCGLYPQYHVGSPSSGVIQVYNNFAGILIEPVEAEVEEGNDAVFHLTRYGGTPGSNGHPLTVWIEVTQDGEYIEGMPPQTVKFRGWPETSYAEADKTIFLRIPTTDDATDERHGAITLRILPPEMIDVDEPSSYEVGVDDRVASFETGTVRVIDNDYYPPTISISDAWAGESDGQIDFFVNVAPNELEMRVEWNTVAETGVGVATEGTDYTAGSGTLTFAVGETAKTITVAVLEESQAESDETFEVVLSSQVNAVLGKDVGVGTIEDDDEGTVVTIHAQEPYGGTEEGQPAEFILQRVNGTSGINVDLKISQQGAFLSPSQPATVNAYIPAGVTELTVEIATINDSTVEANGSVTATLLLGGGYSPGIPDTATVNIRDNDRTISIADAEEGEGRGSMIFAVTLSAPAENRVTVEAYTHSGKATASSAVTETSLGQDFVGRDERLVFEPGETEKSFTVTLVDDAIDESAEEFTVRLSGPSWNVWLTEAAASATGTINDNDDPMNARIFREVRRVDEDRGRAVRFAVELTHSTTVASERDTKLFWEVKPGTATDDLDFAKPYSQQRGTLAIPIGHLTSAIEVNLIDDDLLEEALETFTVELVEAQRLVLPDEENRKKIEISIRDDERLSAAIAPREDSVIEGEDAVFEVRLSGGVTMHKTVLEYTVTGDAEPGSDYTAPSGTLTIKSGGDTGTITIPTKDDSELDPDETLVVTLTSGKSGSRNANIPDPTATATILDPGMIAVSVSPAEAEEGGTLSFALTLSEASQSDVTVDWETADDPGAESAATADVDYAAAASTLIVPAGNTSAVITVRTIDDARAAEGTETFRLDLTHARIDSGPDAGDLPLGVSTAVGTVLDNDIAPTRITLTATPDRVSEDAEATALTVTAALNGQRSLANDTRVLLALEDGTAAADEDYEAATAWLTIPAGEMSAAAALTLAPVNDAVREDDETVSITGDADGLTVTTAQVTITDDDTAPTGVTLTLAPGVIGEGAGETELTVTATLTGGDLRQVDTRVTILVEGVSLTLDDGATTAANAADFAADPVTLTIPAARMNGSATLAFTPVDDTLAEGDETAQVSGAAEGLTVTPAHMTIEDNDQAPTRIVLSASPAEVTEGDGDTTLTVNAYLEGGSARISDTDVSLTVDGLTARPGADFTAQDGVTLTIPAGRMSHTADLTITPVDDDIAENAEMFAVRGSNAEPGLPVSGVRITLSDNDARPTSATLSIDRNTVREDGGAQRLTVTAVLDGSSRLTVDTSVRLTLVGKTAAESDYTALTGVLTIQAGERKGSGTLVLVPTDDYIDEMDETLEVKGSTSESRSGPQLEVSGVVVTIRDDDTAGVTVKPTVLSVVEGGSNSYGVALDTQPGSVVTVAVSGHSGTGITLSGDTLTDDTLTFTASNWNTAQTVTVSAAQDHDIADKADVTLTHTVTGTAEYATVTADSVTVTIADDDTAGVTVSKTELGIDEGADATYTVVLDTEPTDDVAVAIAGHSGTDITLSGATLTFTSDNWNTAQTVTVSAAQDDDAASDAAVTLTHTANGGGYVDVQETVTVTIVETDTSVLSVGDGQAVEDGGNVVFTVSISAAAGEEVTVGYATSDVTATAGEDYTETSGTLTFPANSVTSQTVSVPVTDDTVDEAEEETFTLTLSNVHEASLADGSSTLAATGTIIDNDDPIVTASFAQATYDVNEGRTVEVTVSLSADPEREVTIPLTHDPRGDTGSADYSGVPASLVFQSGDTEKSFTFTATADDIDDDGESVALTFRTPMPAGVTAGATTTVTITDDDTAGVTISKTALSVDEGDSASYTVKLASQPTASVTVAIAGHSGTDITLSGATLTFTASNWNTAQTVTVTAARDTDAASDAVVTLTHTVTGTGEYLGVTARSVTVTIVEKDASVLSVSDEQAAENGGNIVFTVSISAAGGEAVTVDYATSNGTATAGQDYTSTNGTLTFPANSVASKTISVPVTDDTVDEAEVETFTLTLSNVQGASLVGGGSTLAATGTITDNDDPTVTTSFAQTAYSVDEGGTVQVTVTLSADPEREVTIRLIHGLHGGISDADYSGVPANLVFRSGVTENSFTFTAAADDIDDDGESVALTFQTPMPSGVNAGATTTVNITDNDDPTVTANFGRSSYSVNEGGTVQVTVTLSADPEREVTIPLTRGPQGGISDADYSGVPASLVFGSGDTEKSFTFRAAGDDIDDDGESVALAFGTLPAGVNAGATATVTITDNDDPPVTVSFGQASYTVTEGNSIQLKVTLSADPERTVTVPITATHQGGATNADYSLPDNVTFNRGDTEKSITFEAATDDDNDDGESVNLIFGNLSPGVSTGSTATSTVTITDNDDPTVTASFAQTDYSVDEGGTVEVTVTLSADPEREVTIRLIHGLHGGISDADYSGVPANLVFRSGVTENSFTFTAAADDIDDDGESVALTFRTPMPSGVNAGATTTVAITDDDERGVAISKTALEIAEGASGTYTVRLDTEPTGDVAVAIAGHSGTDITLSGATLTGDALTFTADNWNTAQTVTVSAAEDDDTDADPAVTLTHTVAGGDYQGQRAVGVTVTITENDQVEPPTPQPAVTVSFEKDYHNLSEGASGGAGVGLLLSAALENDVTIPIGVLPQSTASSEDYSGIPNGITFAEGETYTYFRVHLVADTVEEEDEQVWLGLGSLPDGVSAGNYSQTYVRIFDAARVSFGSSSYVATEGRGDAVVTVRLNKPLPHDVSIPMTAEGGSGATSDDWSGVPQKLTFASGDTEKTFTVVAVDDTVEDDGEMVTLGFGTLSDRLIAVSPATAVVTLMNMEDDPDAADPPVPASPHCQGTTAAVGSVYTGTIKTAGETGWWTVELDPRKSYTIHTRGADIEGGGTLPHAETLQFSRSDGGFFTAYRHSTAVGFPASLLAKFDIWLTKPGIYCFEVGTRDNEPGTYNLEVESHGYNHNYDVPADTSTKKTIATPVTRILDGGFLGDHGGSEPDEDWFRVPLDGGVEYRILLSADTHEEERHQLTRPKVVGIHHTDGTAIDGTASTGTGKSVSVDFTPARSGNYYIAVGSNSGDATGMFVLCARVIAQGDADNCGGRGNSHSGYAPPRAPRNLRVSQGNSQELDVSWERVSSSSGPGKDTQTYGYKVQWKRASNSWDDGDEVTVSHRVPGASYTITGLDNGVAYAVRVRAFNFMGVGDASEEVAGSPEQGQGTGLQAYNSPATGGPGIGGTPRVGETLAATTEGISDGDGLIGAVFSYQWIRHDFGTGTDTDIAGATGTSYTVTSHDAGHGIKVRVNFTDDAGHEELLTSYAVAAAAPLPPLTADFPQSPYQSLSHKGADDRPQVIVEFSRAVAAFAKTTPSVSVTGGTVHSVQAYEEDGLEHAWIFFLDPTGTDDIQFSLLTGQSCEAGGVCAADGTTLSTAPGTRTIPGPEEEEDETEPQERPQNDQPQEQEPAGPPPAPQNLTAVLNKNGSVTLIWDASDDDSVTGYQVLRRRPTMDEDALQVHVEDTGSTATTYTDSDVTEGVRHVYLLKAINAAGLSERSNYVNVDPPERKASAPATGAPVISGTAQVDETLTADISGVADEDGLTNASYSYRWIAGGSDIDGASDSTYTLVAADEGKTIKVKVSFTDDANNLETLTSATTAAVAARPNSPATGLPAIGGTAQVGETLTASTSGIEDQDGLENATFSYQWLTDDSAITDATGSTYTLVAAEEGRTIKVQVSFTDDANNAETLTSAETAAVAARPNSPATGAPTIGGTAQVGETLTADTSDISDGDGLDNATFTYQWLADDSAITDARGSAYTLVATDKGRTIKVRVSFIDNADSEETLTSAATATVEAPPNNPATGAPTISGTAQVGETLTADTAGIADADGLDNATFTYQWLADDADISGATGSTYTLTDSNEGKAIRVRVSFTDDAGNEEELTSAATDAVAAATQPNNPATGAPTISGTAQVGETLTAATSGIADDDGLGNASFTYQWIAGGTDIAGATGATYTLTEEDEGLEIQVWVSFDDDGGNDETLTSAATDAVAAAEPSGPPASPTGLTAEVSHDSVTLLWDDPNDDDITGYVILRRNRETDAQGQFTELVPDTGTAATTYTDGTVAAETPYTYRIKAINEHGTSERSRWVHVETTAAPTPEGTPNEGTPEQSVSEGDTDLPNDNSTPGRVAVGGSATGAIATDGDQDRFAVELVAGRTYQFDLTGSPGGGGTLPDTFFRAIYDSEGQYQPDSYNDDFDGSRDSRVTFTPTESGTYYARVSGDRDETGSYTLSVTDVTPQ